MKTWLYLTTAGLMDPSPDWPSCIIGADAERTLLTLADAARTLDGQTVHLLLPMELFSWFRTPKWPSRRRPSLQAMGFAIEDQLGEELDLLHLCAGERDRDGHYPVWVTNKARFQALLDLLTELGIELAAIHVDADLLPNDQAYAVWWFDRWLLGGTLDARLAISASAVATLEFQLPSDLCWRDEGQELLYQQLLLGKSDHAINLLQGKFRRAHRRWPWGTALLAGMTLFLLCWGFTEARRQFFDREAEQLYSQSVQRFQTLYPQQTRIVDLSAQLKALQSKHAITAHTQIARLVQLTEQVIGASNVEVQRIEFRAGEGWTLQLTANSFAALDQLRERGQQSGLPIKLGSAHKALNRVQAVLTLEEKS